MTEKKTSIQLMAELSNAVDAAVKAMNDKEADKIEALKTAADEALSAYNLAVTEEAYDNWAVTDDPMRSMLTARYVPAVKRVTFKRDKKTGLFTGSIADNKTKVDLVHYQVTRGKAAFHDSDWFTLAQKLAYVLANCINTELGGDPAFRYEVDSAAIAFDFAPDADPASKKSRVKAVQACVDAIYWDGSADVNGLKVTSHDVAYIMNCITRQGKDALSVVIGNTSKMAELLADVCYRLLVGGKYEAAGK